MKTKYLLLATFLALPCTVIAGEKQESVCFGTTDNGRIENAWKLPRSGSNFIAYSDIGVAAGRTYLHSSIYRIILGSYNDLEAQLPNKKFMYGEIGWKSGGTFRPHKTHQNGLSVDFFVPVIDKNGNSLPLPTSPLNKFGYSIEFTADGKFKDLEIDFDAMAAHLLALKKAADQHGVKIWRVIFDNDLQKLLFKTSRGKELQTQLKFSKKKPWVRHDEHYHVDFIVPCKK